MQAGSNAKAKAFLEDHTDWNSSAPIRVKWNTRAAALYKDKVRDTECVNSSASRSGKKLLWKSPGRLLQLLGSQTRIKLQEELPQKNCSPNLETELLTHKAT